MLVDSMIDSYEILRFDVLFMIFSCSESKSLNGYHYYMIGVQKGSHPKAFLKH